MKFCIITLGCKVNSYESDFIKESLIKCGYNYVDLYSNPDIVVINTCSVTNQSDAKSRHMINLARRENPNACIVACGCSTENHRENYLSLGVDILIGNKDKSKIPELVEDYMKNRTTISKFYDLSNVEFEGMMLRSEEDHTRAFVKIQDGCNNFCSYCIIPYLRGNIRSKDIDEAYNEIEELVHNGHHEIVLTGIHTGSYGRDKDYDLVDLIRRISQIEELKRIRISSIEITELNETFLEELRDNPKICDHLHIPLQAGSDRILKYMNRKYDTDYFREKINSIRSIRPNISITTDLIVGFPHEDNGDFEDTLAFLKEIRFTKIHTFPFSLRNGTKAEEMKEFFVNDADKKERVKKIIELSNELENLYYKSQIGNTFDCIIETSKDGISRGHTSNYILANIKGEYQSGAEVKIKIESVDNLTVNAIVE